MSEAGESGTLHLCGKVHQLRFERLLPHPVAKVWRALTENDELAHWFPARIEGPRERGAKLRFVFPPPPGAGAEEASMDGEMTVYDPPRTLEYSWGDEILRFELEPQGGHTRLVFSHTFEDLGKAARDASGWDVCFDSLVVRLGGEAPEPFTMDRFNALFEEYQRRFGAEASARRQPD